MIKEHRWLFAFLVPDERLKSNNFYSSKKCFKYNQITAFVKKNKIKKITYIMIQFVMICNDVMMEVKE